MSPNLTAHRHSFRRPQCRASSDSCCWRGLDRDNLTTLIGLRRLSQAGTRHVLAIIMPIVGRRLRKINYEN